MKLKQSHLLWAILIVSVLARVAVALYLGDVVDAPPLLTDQRSYHALGASLIQGHGYTFDRPWYPFTPANTPTAHWSFLYSLFIAAVYALFGIHPLAARLVQAILGGLLLPWLTYRLARRAVPEEKEGALPLLAAACAAVYAYLVLYAATLMTETFYIAALLWSLEVALQWWQRIGERKPISPGLVLQLGLGLGVTALLRQSILPWAPVLFLALLWKAWRQRQAGHAFRSLFLAGLLLVLCIVPWTYRNYRAYGQFLLLNSNTGYAMYSAQHPMHGTNFREFDAAPLPDGLEGLNEPQMDRLLLRQGFQFILDDPGRYLLLSLSRLRAFFEFWPSPDTTLINNIGRIGSFGLFLPFMLYGLVLALRRPGFAARNALLLLFCVFYTILHVMTWAMVRYRLPVDAVLLLFAAVALQDLYGRLVGNVKRKDVKRKDQTLSAG